MDEINVVFISSVCRFQSLQHCPPLNLYTINMLFQIRSINRWFLIYPFFGLGFFIILGNEAIILYMSCMMF